MPLKKKKSHLKLAQYVNGTVRDKNDKNKELKVGDKTQKTNNYLIQENRRFSS